MEWGDEEEPWDCEAEAVQYILNTSLINNSVFEKSYVKTRI